MPEPFTSSLSLMRGTDKILSPPLTCSSNTKFYPSRQRSLMRGISHQFQTNFQIHNRHLEAFHQLRVYLYPTNSMLQQRSVSLTSQNKV
jgi:hypothetical protein